MSKLLQVAPDATIAERLHAIRDSIGWAEGADIREHVMALCKEVAILAHQVGAIMAAQDAS